MWEVLFTALPVTFRLLPGRKMQPTVFRGLHPEDQITFKVRATWYSEEEIFTASPVLSAGNGDFWKRGINSSFTERYHRYSAPAISIAASEVNFNSIPVNTSLTLPLIFNTGNSPLHVFFFFNRIFGIFFFTRFMLCESGIKGYHSNHLPAVSGYEMPLTISSDDPLKPTYTVTLNGIGFAQAARCQFPPGVLIFDSAGTGTSFTQTFNILNQGNGSLVISGISSTNADFTVSGPTSFTLTQFQNKDIPVTFKPGASGYYSGNINITDNNGNHTVNLTSFHITFILTRLPLRELHIILLFRILTSTGASQLRRSGGCIR